MRLSLSAQNSDAILCSWNVAKGYLQARYKTVVVTSALLAVGTSLTTLGIQSAFFTSKKEESNTDLKVTHIIKRISDDIPSTTIFVGLCYIVSAVDHVYRDLKDHLGNTL